MQGSFLYFIYMYDWEWSDPFTKCLQAIIAFPVLTYLGYSTRVHVHLATPVHSHSLT